MLLTNSRSSGLFEVGAGITLSSIGVSNVALSAFLSLKIFFAKSHATLRAHLSWCKVSSCDLSLNFGVQGLRWWGSHFWIIHRDGPVLSRIFTWCQMLFGEFNGVFWSQSSFFLTWNSLPRKRILRYTIQLCRLHQQSKLILSHDLSFTFCWAFPQP